MIRDSVTIMRGCFGGCTFCSITTHQGRIISSRSEASVLREVKALAGDRRRSRATVSDLGGPTANMYQMRCTKPEVEQVCRRLSCVHPKVCKLLGTDHGPVIDLMQKARAVQGRRARQHRERHPHGPRPPSTRATSASSPRTTSAGT